MSSIKIAVNKLVKPGIKREVFEPAKDFDSIPAIRNDARPTPAADPALSTGGGGLVSPITWDVLTTETISIPVPAGASSVNVERVKTLTETGAEGTVNNITINYP